MPYKYTRGGSPFYYIGFTTKEKKLGYKDYSTKLKNAKQADAILADLKIDIREKKKKASYKKVEHLTIEQAFKIYCQDRASQGAKYSQLTINNYQFAIMHLNNAVGAKEISAYTRQDYYTFVEYLSKDRSQNTKAIYTRSLYALFRWLQLNGYITQNNFKRVKEVTKPLRILTHAEMKTILNYARATKYFNIVKFIVLSAFRKNEAVNVKWGDIKKTTIHVRGKGDKIASIPIIKPMADFLATLKRGDAKDKLFDISEDMVYRFWSRCKHKTKIAATTHDLRKFTLSEMANSGVPINFVKEYARHTDLKTTLQYYIQADKEKMGAWINKRVKLDFINK